MQGTVALEGKNAAQRRRLIATRLRAEAPTALELGAAVLSAILLLLSFPNFGYSILAWFSLVPLLTVVARRPSPGRALLLGWLTGTLFFYCSCYWLTYSMIHYGGIPAVVAYLLLLPLSAVVGLFPGLFALSTSQVFKVWGFRAFLVTPFLWATSEWLRLGITGQLWNAIGYSQAQTFNGIVIQSARWGGVYLVGFLIVTVNAALAYLLSKRTSYAAALAAFFLTLTFLIIGAARQQPAPSQATDLYLVALQPNVPMTAVSDADSEQLRELHLSLSARALAALPNDDIPRLVVWPESPMNFSYGSDKVFQDLVSKFTTDNKASLIFNSLEPAPHEGSYNSAILINEKGRQIAQYDKIRLLPFGEYVPLPQWLGGSLISAIVGEFTPGESYTLMPVHDRRAGVFICIESAYPYISRQLTSAGADILINISNDGYLGPTAVMRQHLANAIFRAVENGRPLYRVTNTGITALIQPNGVVEDETAGFQTDVRTWRVNSGTNGLTFYTKHGDVFVALCTFITALLIVISLLKRRSTSDHR